MESEEAPVTIRFVIALGSLVAGFVIGALSVSPQGIGGTSTVSRPHEEPTPASETADPLSSARSALIALDRRRTLGGMVQFADSLEKLDSIQIAQLLAHMEKDSDLRSSGRMTWVMEWWLRRDADAASAWASQRIAKLAKDGPLGLSFSRSGIGGLTEFWARERPDEALALARKYPHSGLALVLLSQANRGLRNETIESRLGRMRDFPECKARTSTLIALIRAWSEKSPQSALTAANELPHDSDRRKAVSAALASWPKEDAATAFEYYRNSALSNGSALRTILQNGAFEHEEIGKQWMAVLSPEDFLLHGREFVATWAKRDPAEALKWALEHSVPLNAGGHYKSWIEHDGIGSRTGTSGGDNSYFGSPLSAALNSHPERTLEWIRGLPENDRVRLTYLAAAMAPRLGVALYKDIPDEWKSSISATLVRQFGNDIQKGRAWVESLPVGAPRENAWKALALQLPEPIDLPPGPDRDAMLAGNMFRYGDVDAERSLALVLKIDDPGQKRDALDAGMEYFNETFYNGTLSEKARAWLDKADLPEEWKRQWAPAKKPAAK